MESSTSLSEKWGSGCLKRQEKSKEDVGGGGERGSSGGGIDFSSGFGFVEYEFFLRLGGGGLVEDGVSEEVVVELRGIGGRLGEKISERKADPVSFPVLGSIQTNSLCLLTGNGFDFEKSEPKEKEGFTLPTSPLTLLVLKTFLLLKVLSKNSAISVAHCTSISPVEGLFR